MKTRSTGRAPRTPRRAWLDDSRVIAVLLAAAVLSVYGQVSRFAFINFDDPAYVTENAWVRQGLTTSGIAWALAATELANWHPLTWLSHMVDVQLFGMNAGGHHLTSVALHVVNTLLLFVVLRRMTGATIRSAVVALLFGIHPLHVESVAWIAERKDVLSTTFLFLAIGAYARYAERPSPGRYVGVVLAFVLGLMAKPMLVTFPFLLLLLDFWPLRRWVSDRRGQARLVLEKVPLLAISAAISALTLRTQRGAMGSLESYSLPLRLENAALAYVTYVRKMAWPSDLACFYPYPPALSAAVAIAAALALATISALAVVARRRWPEVFVGWFWYVGMLVPVIGIVQVGRQSMADRYTYVAVVGLFIVLVWGVTDLLARVRARRAAYAALIAAVAVASAASTWRQVSYWQDSATLFRHALVVTRDNYVAALQVGAQFDAEGRRPEAARYYADALRMNPEYAEAHNNLGLALAHSGDRDAAMVHYGAALTLDPEYADAHYNRGVLLQQTGAVAEAAYEYRRTLEIKPSYAKAHNNLGVILQQQGRLDSAVFELAEAVRLRPDFLDARINLGVALRAGGDVNGAIHQYSEALRIDPGSPEAHYNLGNALAQRGDRETAIAHYREALRLKPDYAAARDVLSRALGGADG